MANAKQSAINYAAGRSGLYPQLDIFYPQSLADSDHQIALNTIQTSSKADIGAIAQLFSILNSGRKLSEMTAAVKKLIESGLRGDAEACGAVDKFAKEQFPQFTKNKATLTYRYMLKNIPLNTMVALAATLSWEAAAQHVLLSYMEHGTWREYGDDYGFNMTTYMEDGGPELMRQVMKHGGASVTDACGWFPQGPFPMGFPTAPGASSVHLYVPIPVATSSINITSTQGVPSMSQAIINPAVKPLIDGMLAQAGISFTIDKIMQEIADNTGLRKSLADAEKKADEEIADLRSRLSTQVAMPSTIAIVSSSGVIPSGTMNMVDATSLFPELKGVKLKVPQFTWDAPHPDVPVASDDYIFRKGMLVNALRCLATGENAWLSGHTGSGKTTFIEQIAARLNWPVARVAFDSNVDRSELVGRMNLAGDGLGGTVSNWLPGILETASKHGYILLCDEMDAGHPNALYTLQPLLEGKPLTLLEDGGRMVGRSPMMRIIATGNTTGNGDPSGLYPACRILSAATLDRFQSFVNVPYMTVDEEMTLIGNAVPSLAKEMVARLAKFSTEMRQAFTTNQTPISYSPRRSVAFAREVEALMNMGFKDEKKILSTAFKSKLYDAASEEFRQRLTEIANASLGSIDPTKTVI